MKKFVLLIIILLVAGLLVYKLLSDKNPQPQPPKDQALRIGKNTSVFNSAFAGLMSKYFSMKDALVNSDTVAADHAAYAVAADVDSLPMKQLKADTSIILTAESLAASISGEAKGFTGETGIEARQRSFNMLTDELYNLVRTVRYDGETIYHMRCPTAFNDSEEAFWLSNTSAIINPYPYLGNKDPAHTHKTGTCGEIVDSLDFMKK